MNEGTPTYKTNSVDWRLDLSAHQLFLDRDLIPPDFPEDTLDTEDGRNIAADWWDEAGFPKKATATREQRYLALRTLEKMREKHMQQLCDQMALELFTQPNGSQPMPILRLRLLT